MKLSQSGSLVNYIYSNATKFQPVPQVGMGCTVCWYSDRHVETIKRVTILNQKRYSYEIEIWRDEEIIVSGSCQDGSAEYQYKERMDWEAGKGSVWRFDLQRMKWVQGKIQTNNRWKSFGNSNGLIIGHRESYYDPSF